jgi:hypothetical protein|tara:strand:+ start:707 stop:910 length:204 start_codon:yes stop_codon:yes gene_type:complete
MIEWIKKLFASQTYELVIEHLGTVKTYTVTKVYTLNDRTAHFKAIDGEKYTLRSADKMSWSLRKITK